MKIIVTVLIACLLFPISGLTETKYMNNFDGNDWREWNPTSRSMFITGFLAGTGYASKKSEFISYTINNFDFQKAADLYWSLVDTLLEEKGKVSKKYYSEAEVKQIMEFESKRNKVEIDNYAISNIKVGQIKDGLNLIYADFKNRKILLVDLIYVVRKQINGSSPEEIEAILQWLRSPDKDSKKLPEFIEKDGKKKTVTFP